MSYFEIGIYFLVITYFISIISITKQTSIQKKYSTARTIGLKNGMEILIKYFQNHEYNFSFIPTSAANFHIDFLARKIYIPKKNSNINNYLAVAESAYVIILIDNLLNNPLLKLYIIISKLIAKFVLILIIATVVTNFIFVINYILIFIFAYLIILTTNIYLNKKFLNLAVNFLIDNEYIFEDEQIKVRNYLNIKIIEPLCWPVIQFNDGVRFLR